MMIITDRRADDAQGKDGRRIVHSMMHEEVQNAMYIVQATPAQIEKREGCDKFPRIRDIEFQKRGKQRSSNAKRLAKLSISWVANRGATE